MGAGGLYIASSIGTVLLRNNIFYENTGTDAGGVYIESGGEDTITLTNNTFYSNTGGLTKADFDNSHCNGVLIDADEEDITPVNIYNNILWNNPASDVRDLCVSNPSGDVNLYNNDISLYSIVQVTGVLNNSNNISLNPLFVNPAGGNFHLRASSPSRNTGINSAPGISSIDFEGQPRINEGTVDMGADEYYGDVAVPTMTEWGMIIFVVLAGLGATYYLRKQKTAKS